jgi:hypothetical protein
MAKFVVQASVQQENLSPLHLCKSRGRTCTVYHRILSVMFPSRNFFWCGVAQYGAAWLSMVRRGSVWCGVAQNGAAWLSDGAA